MLPDFSPSSSTFSATSSSSAPIGEKLNLKQFLVVYLKWIMFFTASVSLLCAGLGLVGVTGWTVNADYLKIVGWSFIYSGSIKAWFGLQGFSITTVSNPELQFTYYSESLCSSSVISAAEGSSFCNVCQAAGRTSFGLSIAIVLSMLVVSILSMLRISQNIYVIKITILGFSICQLVLTLAAFANWSQTCFGNINNSVNITSSEWTGFDVTIIGFAFGFVQFVFQLIVPSEADEIFTPKVLNSFNDMVSRMSMAPILRRGSVIPTRVQQRGNDRGAITQKTLDVVPIEL